MLAVVGSPATFTLISELVGASTTDAELLPPEVVPPLPSFGAPVVTVTVLAAVDVGMPATGQVMLAPTATVAGGTGVQAPSVKPTGRPVTPHVAADALAVAERLLVHLMVPEYTTPTVSAVGRPDKSGTISELTVATALVTVLLPPAVAPPFVNRLTLTVKEPPFA